MQVLDHKLLIYACKQHSEIFPRHKESYFFEVCMSTIVNKSRFLLYLNQTTIIISILIFLLGFFLIYNYANKKKQFHFFTLIYICNFLITVLWYFYTLTNVSDSSSYYILGYYGIENFYMEQNFHKEVIVNIVNFLIHKVGLSYFNILCIINILSSFSLILFSKLIFFNSKNDDFFTTFLKFLILFSPSFYIFTSGIGKDVFIFLSTVLILKSITNINKNITLILLSLFLIYFFRSYFLLFLLLSFVFTIVFLSKKYVKLIYLFLLFFLLISIYQFNLSTILIKYLFLLSHTNEYFHSLNITNFNDILNYFSLNQHKILYQFLESLFINPIKYFIGINDYNKILSPLFIYECLLLFISIFIFFKKIKLYSFIKFFDYRIIFLISLFGIILISYSNISYISFNIGIIYRQKIILLLIIYYIIFNKDNKKNKLS